jgi:hypothetical protein
MGWDVGVKGSGAWDFVRISVFVATLFHMHGIYRLSS